MTSATDQQTMSLKADYASPTNAPFTVTHQLLAPPSGMTKPTVPDKTRYLADLRKATTSLQDQINKELTQRMEEDKAAEVTKNGKASSRVDDAKEEENYGEEVQEEDE